MCKLVSCDKRVSVSVCVCECVCVCVYHEDVWKTIFFGTYK